MRCIRHSAPGIVWYQLTIIDKWRKIQWDGCLSYIIRVSAPSLNQLSVQWYPLLALHRGMSLYPPAIAPRLLKVLISDIAGSGTILRTSHAILYTIDSEWRQKWMGPVRVRAGANHTHARYSGWTTSTRICAGVIMVGAPWSLRLAPSLLIDDQPRWNHFLLTNLSSESLPLSPVSSLLREIMQRRDGTVIWAILSFRIGH